MRPCSSLHDTHGCPSNAFVCQTKQNSDLAANLGNDHFKVTVLNNGDVEMRINGTSKCHHARQDLESMKQTIIQFTCSLEEKVQDASMDRMGSCMVRNGSKQDFIGDLVGGGEPCW